MLLKKIPKQVLLLSIVSFFTDIASEMLYPVTPIFLTAVLGSSMAVVGIIEGIAEISAGFLKGYFGNLSDKLGKRSIFVIIGYGISALSKPIPGLIASVPSVIVSRTTDRIGKGIRTAPRDALLGSYSNGNTGFSRHAIYNRRVYRFLKPNNNRLAFIPNNKLFGLF